MTILAPTRTKERTSRGYQARSPVAYSIQDQIQLDFSLPHALVEARKDGLTGEDLAETVMTGEVIEDYGERVLLLNFTEDRKIPIHIVLEFLENDSIATVVTAYIPSDSRWERNWKARKKAKGSKKKRKR